MEPILLKLLHYRYSKWWLAVVILLLWKLLVAGHKVVQLI